jgi:hypothetical protein
MIEKRTISPMAMFLLPGEVKASALREMIKVVILLEGKDVKEQEILATARTEFPFLKYSTRQCS